MPITPGQALTQLRTNPQAFLSKFPVRIFGDPTASRVSNFRIEDDGGSTRPGSIVSLRRHTTQRFAIR